MADPRASFPVLEDGTGAGVALDKSQQGDAGASKVGATAFTFRDSSGNLILPQLTSEGKVPVDFEGAGVAKSGTSGATPVPGSLTFAVVASVTLSASKTYGKISARLSCRRAADVVLVQIDGASETVIGHAILDAGQYNAIIDLGIAEIVSGASGTQKIELRAKNFSSPVSDFRGTVACLEFAS